MRAGKYTIFLVSDQDATVSSTLSNTVFLSLGPQLGEVPPSAKVVTELLIVSTEWMTFLVAGEFGEEKDPLFCVCSVEEGAHVGCLWV